MQANTTGSNTFGDINYWTNSSGGNMFYPGSYEVMYVDGCMLVSKAF